MFLCSVALVTLLAAQAPSRDASLSSALAELNKGRVLEGIEQFKQIIRNDPANETAYFYLSTLYTELRNTMLPSVTSGAPWRRVPGKVCITINWV